MIELTSKLPDKPGFYYWTCFGEHTPTILEVRKHNNGDFYAFNEEYGFNVGPKEEQQEFPLEEDDVIFETEKRKYRYGDHLWGYIPLPSIDGIEVELDSF